MQPIPRSLVSLRLRAGLALIVLAAVLLGCARVEDDQPGATATGSAVPSATATSVATASINPCADWAATAQHASGAFSGAAPELRVSIPRASAAFTSFATSAPPALTADVQTLADAWAVVAKEMARVEYDPTRLAADVPLRNAIAAFSGPPTRDAQTRLDAWSRSNCPAAGASPTPTARP